MNCELVRARMLEADLSELRGRSDGALARHLAACPACAALAARILAAHADLDHALRTLAGTAPAPPLPSRRHWRRAALLVPLAAAAVLAVIIARPPRLEPPLPARATPRQVAPVNASPGGGVAVMQTRDPDITVFWTF